MYKRQLPEKIIHQPQQIIKQVLVRLMVSASKFASILAAKQSKVSDISDTQPLLLKLQGAQVCMWLGLKESAPHGFTNQEVDCKVGLSTR